MLRGFATINYWTDDLEAATRWYSEFLGIEPGECARRYVQPALPGRSRVHGVIMQTLAFRDAAEWESWLIEHHATEPGVWLKIAKKGSAHGSVTAEEADEVALCYGWIDSTRKSHDREFFLQKFSPRRRWSSWSRVNVKRAEALIAAGRMQRPGFVEIEAAKEDGRWHAAYEPQRTATIPADLADALAQDEQARTFFESLGRTDRYALILRLSKTRSAAVREAQLRRIVGLLQAGERVS
jgi:uncharacterized protein YdeI (YjbR/CyaY-like superfamily)